ncbi:hypothetical protein CEXT_104861 [Caerostris extrusa]|uniref:Uncharacterized protein n=1 Tax=Caerostris extrusa TaxID=172846 RepID=A0AAV4XTQ8_CAEEX|nr:hypothetical protein CEXT_104861 [Caerostris extrusa]
MLNHLCPAFLLSRSKRSGPRCFCDKESSSNKEKGSLSVRTFRNYSFSDNEEPFLPLTTEIRTESTRDNRRIPDDICSPSSTNRDFSPSNDQMSLTRGTLSRSTSSKSSAFWRIR